MLALASSRRSRLHVPVSLALPTSARQTMMPPPPSASSSRCVRMRVACVRACKNGGRHPLQSDALSCVWGESCTLSAPCHRMTWHAMSYVDLLSSFSSSRARPIRFLRSIRFVSCPILRYSIGSACFCVHPVRSSGVRL
jgi:hypothetical protein